MFNPLKTPTWKSEVMEKAQSYEDMGFDKKHAFCYAKESRNWSGVEMSERCDKCSNYEQCLQTRNTELKDDISMESVNEFIKRRFPNEDDLLGTGSYYMALILKDRFNGDIYYDGDLNQFLCKIGDFYYNHAGMCEPKSVTLFNLPDMEPSVVHDFMM